jgi:predicted metal-dependent hydrolase
VTLDPRYLRGIDHFNRGEYFEAHEVWEDLWIELNDERKGFYHGLIQAAVALHHASRANPNGARSLFRRMKANLDGYRPAYEGLDVDAFLARMDACCAPVFEVPPKPVDEARFPKIALTA